MGEIRTDADGRRYEAGPRGWRPLLDGDEPTASEGVLSPTRGPLRGRSATTAHVNDEGGQGGHRGGDGPDRVILVSAADIKPEQARFVFGGRLSVGSLSLATGMPDLGKSSLVTYLAARISRGQLDGDFDGVPGDVIIATAEDAPAFTVVPRLIAAGADRSRVHFIHTKIDGATGAITLPDDVEAITARGRQMDKLLAVILDPVMAYVADRVNTHREHHLRRMFSPLATMAEELEVLVVAVMHLNKAAGTDPLLRVAGSLASVAAARSVLLVAPDPDDATVRILAHSKNNLGPKAPSLRFGIEGRTVQGDDGESIGTSGIVWMGEAPGVSARDLLVPISDDDRTERDEAIEWLVDFLAGGPQPASVVERAAKEAGVSERTLRRAKASAGVRSRKGGMGVGWAWFLPTSEGGHDTSEGGQPPEGGSLRPQAAETSSGDPEGGHVSGIGSLRDDDPNRTYYSATADDPDRVLTPEESANRLKTEMGGVDISTARQYIAALRAERHPLHVIATLLNTHPTRDYPPPPGFGRWTVHAVLRTEDAKAFR